MKPRLRRRFGIWYCGLFSGRAIWPPYGHGLSPAEAYGEWRDLCRSFGEPYHV